MTDKDLLRRISRSAGHRAGYKQLVRELGLGGGRERRLLLEQLARLTARGELTKADREQWAIPTPTSGPGITGRAVPGRDSLIGGKLDLRREGYGFVRPEMRAKTGEDDIFIPPDAMEGAMQGDLVLVQLLPARGDGRRSGRIARVLERHNPTVVGIFHYTHGERTQRGERIPGNYVTPLNARISEAILIPFGAEVLAVPEKKSPNRVLGSHSHEQAVVNKTGDLDLEGLVVDVEITAWPTATRPARGGVIEVLGERDAFGVDVEILIRKHHLPHTFPDGVIEEARRVAVPPEREPGAYPHRRDFRGLPIVTIDGETAKDFDDAVLVRKLDGSADGAEYELQVHIADVAHYVLTGSALDVEARVRGNSVYFPDRAIPMLPSELSSDVCSLLPDEDRLVLSCIMRLDARGEILSSEICEGIIRSARRMTYTQVHAILEGNAHDSHGMTREQFAPLVPEFERMYELAQLMNARREQRGSIDFDLPEPVIEFDENGQMRGIVRSERTWANRLIEELMLAANECVASWIETLGVPSIYRIHEKPDSKRVVDFEEIAAHFGYSLGIGALPVKRFEMRGDRRERMRQTSRGNGSGTRHVREISEDIAVTPQMYQKLTARLAGKPEERILTYLMLRSLKQARYSEKNEGHFALATPSYTHFTSPIRRYADLIVHRIAKAMLASGVSGHRDLASGNAIPRKHGSPQAPAPLPAPIDAYELSAIAQEVSECERRAADAERELIEWKKVRFMQDKIGEEFSGIILNVTKYGLFVELDDLFVEGLVPLAGLQGDQYRFNENSRQAIAANSGHRISVGDQVRVILDRIDAVENKLQFALLEAESASNQKDTGKKPGKAAQKKTVKKAKKGKRARR